MRTQHNRRLLLCRHSHHPQIPSHIAQRIRHITHDFARESLIAIRIREAEGDTVLRMGDHRPIAPIPAIRPAMQRIDALGAARLGVLIRQHMERLAIDLEAGIADAVGVAARHGAEVRVLAVDGVVAGVVEAAHDVALDAGRVVEEEVRDGRPVWHEQRADAGAPDLVFAVHVGAPGVPGDGGIAYGAGEHLAGDLGRGGCEGDQEGGRDGGRGLPQHCEGVRRGGRGRERRRGRG